MKIKYIIKYVQFILCFDAIYSLANTENEPNKRGVSFSSEVIVVNFCPHNRYDPKNGDPKQSTPPYTKRGSRSPYSKEEHSDFLSMKQTPNQTSPEFQNEYCELVNMQSPEFRTNIVNLVNMRSHELPHIQPVHTAVFRPVIFAENSDYSKDPPAVGTNTEVKPIGLQDN